MKIFWILVRRDLGLTRWGAVALPVLFFLLTAALFPFAVGPDATILARIAGGVMWVAALLAALLPIDTLFEHDRADGTIDQYVVRGLALETIAVARILSHWLTFGVPLLLCVPVAGTLLKLPDEVWTPLLLGLTLGTPALAALGVAVAALTAGLRGAGALTGLLVLPLALPVLIFGAGMLMGAIGAGKLLAAISLVLVTMSPFAAGAGLRAGLE